MVLSSLTIATSLAVATVSVWLVPPYLLLMAALVFAPGEERRGASRPEPGRDGLADGGAEASSDGADLASDAGRAADSDETAPGSEAAAGSMAAAPAATKTRRGKGRGRKAKAAVVEPSAAATWVQVGPGKFVRVEAASPDGTADAEPSPPSAPADGLPDQEAAPAPADASSPGEGAEADARACDPADVESHPSPADAGPSVDVESAEECSPALPSPVAEVSAPFPFPSSSALESTEVPPPCDLAGAPADTFVVDPQPAADDAPAPAVTVESAAWPEPEDPGSVRAGDEFLGEAFADRAEADTVRPEEGPGPGEPAVVEAAPAMEEALPAPASWDISEPAPAPAGEWPRGALADGALSWHEGNDAENDTEAGAEGAGPVANHGAPDELGSSPGGPLFQPVEPAPRSVLDGGGAELGPEGTEGSAERLVAGLQGVDGAVVAGDSLGAAGDVGNADDVPGPEVESAPDAVGLLPVEPPTSAGPPPAPGLGSIATPRRGADRPRVGRGGADRWPSRRIANTRRSPRAIPGDRRGSRRVARRFRQSCRTFPPRSPPSRREARPS